MRSVHYFPRYSQAENVVTNNALLLLLRLRELNPLKFEDMVEQLCSDNGVQFSPQWFRFAQQVGTGTAVVDGFIAQESVKIGLETKRFGTFDAAQLERHLSLFGGETHKLLILLCPDLSSAAEEKLRSSQALALSRGVQLLQTSFAELIRRVRQQLANHDEAMRNLVDDFESFCEEMSLLPDDEHLLFVPPCGPSFRDNDEFRLYYCPADRTRRKAKYLGVYAGKQVRYLGRVAKVVTCQIDLDTKSVVVMCGAESLTAAEELRILGAAGKAPAHGWSITQGDHKFFLCDEWAETEFIKTSPGGIMGHRYFDLRKVLGPNYIQDTSSIAEALRDVSWA